MKKLSIFLACFLLLGANVNETSNKKFSLEIRVKRLEDEIELRRKQVKTKQIILPFDGKIIFGDVDTSISGSSTNVISFKANDKEVFTIQSGGVFVYDNLYIGGTATYDFGSASYYPDEIHYVSAVTHSLIDVNDSTTTIKGIDIEDKSSYPPDIYIKAQKVGEKDGINMTQLTAYLIKCNQELLKRIEKLEKK